MGLGKSITEAAKSRFYPISTCILATCDLPELRRAPGLVEGSGETLDGAFGLDDGAAVALAELDEHRADVLVKRLAGGVHDERRLGEGVVAEGGGEQDIVVERGGDLQQDVPDDVLEVEDRRNLDHHAVLAVHHVDAGQGREHLQQLVADGRERVVLAVLLSPASAAVGIRRAAVHEHRVQVDGDLGAVDVLQLQHHSRGHVVLSPQLWRGCLSHSERVFFLYTQDEVRKSTMLTHSSSCAICLSMYLESKAQQDR
jgi:hypothetical protein